MPWVHANAELRRLGMTTPALFVTGTTLREVLEALDQQLPGARERLCQAQRLRPGLMVSIDGAHATSLHAAVPPAAEIHLLPAIGGG